MVRFRRESHSAVYDEGLDFLIIVVIMLYMSYREVVDHRVCGLYLYSDISESISAGRRVRPCFMVWSIYISEVVIHY